MCIRDRSFAAGTAFSKTEVLQAAIFEAIILGHIVNFKLGLAIILGVIAVFLLSLAKSKLTFKNLLNSLFTKQAALGLGSGAFWDFVQLPIELPLIRWEMVI